MIFLVIVGGPLPEVGMIMIVMPMFMPLIESLGLNPVWFGVLMLLNSEISALSPPYGGLLFVMKAVAPSNVTMGDVFSASIPFVFFNSLVMIVIVAFPEIVVWPLAFFGLK